MAQRRRQEEEQQYPGLLLKHACLGVRVHGQSLCIDAEPCIFSGFVAPVMSYAGPSRDRLKDLPAVARRIGLFSTTSVVSQQIEPKR